MILDVYSKFVILINKLEIYNLQRWISSKIYFDRIIKISRILQV